MTEFTVRLATTADIAAVTSCVKSAYQHYIQRMGIPPAPTLEDYKSVIDNHPVWVAELTDGHLAGVLVLKPNPPDSMLLDNIAVHPHAQGKGIGKYLLDLAESEARKLGLEKITLYTHQLMRENLAIYSALGYVETERKTVQGYDRIYMEKRVVP